MFHWFCGIWAVFFLMEFNLKNILLLFASDITIWLYTKRAQFPELNFPNICHNFEPFTKTSSVCANTNWASTSCAEVEKINYFFRKFRFCVSQKSNPVFWNFLFSPVSELRHWANAARSVTDGRGSIPSRPPASYCPRLPSFCGVSVLFLTRTSAIHPACCTRLLLHTLCLLP